MFYCKILPLFVVLIFVFSCAEQNPMWTENKQRQTAWICHNPESEYHEKECTEDTEKKCLETGKQSKFCWLLSIEDCTRGEFEKKFDLCKER